MMRLIFIFAFLIAVVQIYAQSLTRSQARQVLRAQALQEQAQSQTSQSTQMTSTAQAAEIAAAKEILSQTTSLSSMSDSLRMAFFDGLDSAFRDTSAFAGKRFTRYENIIFSQSLPTAFYEVQGLIPADYPLKHGDNLELSLWGAVEKQFALSVNNQGNVFVEGAGLINVANLNLGEAEKLITKKLQSIYSGIIQGRISVNLRPTRLSPTKVFVMGAVKRPGGYDLPGNSNVFLALYKAGGSDDYGSVRNIIIRRANGDSAKIDLYDFLLRGKKSGEGLLRDGDLVFVPKAQKLVKATGTIGRPAIYELKNGETLTNLLAFAGGLLPNTDHTINLWRINETGAPDVFDPGPARDFASGKKEFQMQDGDSIFVFSSTKPNTNAIQVAGSVFYPGFYVWTEGMSIKDAVALAGGLSSEAFKDRAVIERVNADSSYSYFSDDFNGSRKFKLLAGDNVIVLDSRILKSWRTISVTGYVKEPSDFEWQENLDALDLIALCGGFLPNANKNEITIERLREGNKIENITFPVKNELSVKSNKNIIVKPGDRVVVTIDTSYYEQEIIALTGAFKNPGFYSLVKRGETFKNFINRVAIMDESAYIKGGQLFRKVPKSSDIVSTVSGGLLMNNMAMGNMGMNNMGMGNMAMGNMGMNNMGMGNMAMGNMGMNNMGMSNMASSMSNANFIDTSTTSTKLGRARLAPKTRDTSESYRINFDFERVMKGKDKDIELQANDSIYVPFEMLTVNVVGEVISPGHVLWRKGWDADDYINAAGGFTITGDEDRVVLTYANGSKIKKNKAKEDPNPGSTIQVFYKPLPEPTRWTEVVTAIGTLATAFATIALVVLR
jgi:protein involved in polysaccharide export with SLBB domain